MQAMAASSSSSSSSCPSALQPPWPSPSPLPPPPVSSSSSSPGPSPADPLAIRSIAADPAPLPLRTPSARPLRHRFSSLPVPGPATPPFLTKTFDLVDDVATNAVISWNATGNGFIVWDLQALCQCLLPQYFRHGNFASFVRQLNTYGFRKIDPERWEFANEDFARGKRSLLQNIRRKKSAGAGSPHHCHHQLQQAVGLSASGMLGSDSKASIQKFERLALREELDGLKHEVFQMAHRLRSSEEELQTICHRLQLSRVCEQHMMAFVVKAVRDRSFLSQLVQQHSSESSGMPKRQRIAGLMATSAQGGDTMMDVDSVSAVCDTLEANRDQQSRTPMPLSPYQLELQDKAGHQLAALAGQGSRLPTAESQFSHSSGGYGMPEASSTFAASRLGKSTMRSGQPPELLLHSRDMVLQYNSDIEGAGAALPVESGHTTSARECTTCVDSWFW